MIKMQVTSTGEAIVADFRDMPENVLKAGVRAINRAITSARAAMASEMAKDTGLRVGDIKDAIRLRQATVDRPVAMIGASLKRMPLADFNPTGPYPSRGRGRGISYKLGTGGRGRLTDAFFADVHGSGGGTHRGVFRRIGSVRRRGPKPNRSQLPIKELYGPSLGHVFAKVKPIGLQTARESFEKNFAHELEFVRGLV